MSRSHLREVLKAQVRDTLEAGASLAYGSKEQVYGQPAFVGTPNKFEPVVIEAIKKSNPGYSM